MTECPICGGPMPAPKSTGRPRQFCATVCAERARSRRKRAAQLLEFALVVEHGVSYGDPSPEGERRRAAARQERVRKLRQDAAAAIEGIGPG